jgi:hypothetical protein
VTRLVTVGLALVVVLEAAGPGAAQSITCPAGATLRSTETAAGKVQWCEMAARGGPIRHGPMVGFHPNGRRSLELSFVDGTPRGSIQAWYESGQPSASGETRPDNGTLTLWDERGRKRALIEVRDRQVVTQAWDEQGREERYDEARLAKALAANRDLSFIMTLFAVGIGIQ